MQLPPYAGLTQLSKGWAQANVIIGFLFFFCTSFEFLAVINDLIPSSGFLTPILYVRIISPCPFSCLRPFLSPP